MELQPERTLAGPAARRAGDSPRKQWVDRLAETMERLVPDAITTSIVLLVLLFAIAFPVLTFVVSTIVAMFIPTSGGQWLIQGFVTVQTAEAVGATAQRGLLALSVGDHMGNLITPFWAVVDAGIARADFRLVFGYRLLFAALWFVMGVLAFTFLPC